MSLVKREIGCIPYIGMGTFFNWNGYPPKLRGRDRHIIVIFTWEENNGGLGKHLTSDTV